MIDPVVRAATVADTPQLAWLEAESRARVAEQRGGPRWLATHPAVGERWSERVGDGGVFVALIDGVVIGYLVAAADDRLARIDDVYVTPAARELGFGDELLAAAIRHARATGAELLEGEALPGDRDTKNLYERAGIKARLITVSTPL